MWRLSSVRISETPRKGGSDRFAVRDQWPAMCSRQALGLRWGEGIRSKDTCFTKCRTVYHLSPSPDRKDQHSACLGPAG